MDRCDNTNSPEAPYSRLGSKGAPIIIEGAYATAIGTILGTCILFGLQSATG
jgi:hypothetical protein